MIKYTRVFKTATLQLTQGSDGFWLYDTVAGMNLSMRASTEQAAFIEALEYYQKRLTSTRVELNTLRSRVASFVEDVRECPDVCTDH